MNYELQQILLSLIIVKRSGGLGVGSIILLQNSKRCFFANILALLYSYPWSMDPYVFKSWNFFTLLLFWPFLVLFI